MRTPAVSAARGAAWIGTGLFATVLAQTPSAAPACEPPWGLDPAAGRLLTVRCGAETPPLAGAARLLFGLPLDANRAGAAALEALPGIGPARAAAWTRERALRPFCSLSELERVPGVGSRTRARLAELVSVTPEPDCATASERP